MTQHPVERSSIPIVTECFLIRDGRVLLGRKKRGLGAGKMVGIGGKVETNETPLHGAIRELREETGAVVPEDAMEFRGLVEWRFPNKPAWEMLAHVYVAKHWSGDLIETAEIVPVWFAFDEVPYDLMWPDAKMWVDGVLRGGSAHLLFVYGPDNASIVSMSRRTLSV